MNRLALALAGFGGLLAYLWNRGDLAPVPDYGVQDLGEDQSGVTAVATGLQPEQLPAVVPARDDRNAAAALMMVRVSEGTAKEGGYGALFGWPMAGRSFDPYTVQDHPKLFFSYTDKAGKTLKTSAAGAYQITWTTWIGYQVAFRVWASLNGYNVKGFTPETQDAFALFLMDRRGALADFKAGRVDAGLAKARKEWASLPGAGYNQPERTRDFVVAAYQAAGGSLA